DRSGIRGPPRLPDALDLRPERAHAVARAHGAPRRRVYCAPALSPPTPQSVAPGRRGAEPRPELVPGAVFKTVRGAADAVLGGFDSRGAPPAKSLVGTSAWHRGSSVAGAGGSSGRRPLRPRFVPNLVSKRPRGWPERPRVYRERYRLKAADRARSW